MLKVDNISNSNATFLGKSPKILPQQKIQFKKSIEDSSGGVVMSKLSSMFVKLTDKFKMSYEQVLKKNGIVIKDNLAVIEKNGRKYTGKIQGFLSFNKIKTAEFSDGVVTEEVHHNILGQELDGTFYVNGIRRFAVSPGTRNYVLYSYDKAGNLESRMTCMVEDKKKFDSIRDLRKK